MVQIDMDHCMVSVTIIFPRVILQGINVLLMPFLVWISLHYLIAPLYGLSNIITRLCAYRTVPVGASARIVCSIVYGYREH